MERCVVSLYLNKGLRDIFKTN